MLFQVNKEFVKIKYCEREDCGKKSEMVQHYRAKCFELEKEITRLELELLRLVAENIRLINEANINK